MQPVYLSIFQILLFKSLLISHFILKNVRNSCFFRHKPLISHSPQIQHKAPQLRYDVIEANFYSGTLANAYGMDVLDLHFLFRFSLHHRTKDGVHWNAIAHRMISSLLLQHIAQAWGVILTSPTLTPIGETARTHTHTKKYALTSFVACLRRLQ